jgi:hypothetical protein
MSSSRPVDKCNGRQPFINDEYTLGETCPSSHLVFPPQAAGTEAAGRLFFKTEINSDTSVSVVLPPTVVIHGNCTNPNAVEKHTCVDAKTGGIVWESQGGQLDKEAN